MSNNVAFNFYGPSNFNFNIINQCFPEQTNTSFSPATDEVPFPFDDQVLDTTDEMAQETFLEFSENVTAELLEKEYKIKYCRSCGTFETSQWRTAGTGYTLCNPEGLALKNKKKGFKLAENFPIEKTVEELKEHIRQEKLQKTIKKVKTCAFCGTHDTPQWRRSANGLQACNKCGLSPVIKPKRKVEEVETEKDQNPPSKYTSIQSLLN